MKKTIFGRTFTATALLLLISFVLLGSSVAAMALRYSRTEREKTLGASADAIVMAANNYIVNGDVASNISLTRAVEMSSKLSGFQIAVTDSTGRLVASPEGIEYNFRLYVGEGIMRRVQSGKFVSDGNLGGLYTTDYFTVGRPVSDSRGEFAGAVFVSVQSTAYQKMIGGFIRVFVIMAMVVLATASIWAYFYTSRLTQPLQSMADASRAFARGDFSERVDVREDDVIEMAELAASLNSMAESLDKSETRRREFIANVSHELKTPMTSISGYVDGILDGVIPPEKERKYLETVSSETKRLSRLVTQMLEVSRVEAEQAEPLRMTDFDLCEVARQVLISQEKKITDKQLEVDARLDDAAEVRADSDAIYRVVFNLVENAVKYCDPSTTLSISITTQQQKAVFSVTDTGRPIPPEERERIFERFHQTDRSRRGEGLGLGLYLVRTILARHGESVECITDGAVTTMKFTLPLAPKK